MTKVTHKDAIAQLRALGDPAKAADMHRYHKIDRPYLGLSNPVIDEHVKSWRDDIDLDQRLALARGLWKGNIHEGRIAAAKLLTQARIRPDDTDAWQLICDWVPALDVTALADHVCTAGQKRLVADPARLDTVANWVTSDHAWTRRAALVMTLPWTKQNHPKPADLAIRDRVLGWAGSYAADHDPIIQKAIAGWLRELAKHDPDRVQAFLDTHAEAMKPATVKDASRKLAS